MKILVKVVSIVMMVLGIVGLVASLVAFGAVAPQAENADKAVADLVTSFNREAASWEDMSALLGGLNADLPDVQRQASLIIDDATAALGTASSSLTEVGKGLSGLGAILPAAQSQAGLAVDSAAASLDAAAGSVTGLAAGLGAVNASLTSVQTQVLAIVDSAAASLDSAALSVAGVATGLGLVNASLPGVQTQLAQIVNGAAASLDSASGAVAVVGGVLATADQGVASLQQATGGVKATVQAAAKQSAVQLPGTAITIPLNRITGDDLIAIGQYVQRTYGIDASMLVAQGTAYKSLGYAVDLGAAAAMAQVDQTMVLVDSQVQQIRTVLGETGKQVSALDASLKTLASSVRATNTTGALPLLLGAAGTSVNTNIKDLGTLAASLSKAATDIRAIRGTVADVVSQVVATLNTVSGSLGTLNTSLVTAARDVRATKGAVTSVVGQATTFVNTTNTQLAGLSTSLGTTSRDLGASKATVTKLAGDLEGWLDAAKADMDQGAIDYRDTVKTLGDVKLGDAVNSALSSLKLYMCLTYILFILTGAVLFVFSLRVPLAKA